jgi:hypothetical protein
VGSRTNRHQVDRECKIYPLVGNEPSTTRRHVNFAGVHTLLRILLSSNSASRCDMSIIIPEYFFNSEHSPYVLIPYVQFKKTQINAL